MLVQGKDRAMLQGLLKKPFVPLKMQKGKPSKGNMAFLI